MTQAEKRMGEKIQFFLFMYKASIRVHLQASRKWKPNVQISNTFNFLMDRLCMITRKFYPSTTPNGVPVLPFTCKVTSVIGGGGSYSFKCPSRNKNFVQDKTLKVAGSLTIHHSLATWCCPWITCYMKSFIDLGCLYLWLWAFVA